MPFLKVDAEAFEGLGEEFSDEGKESSGEFEYSPAETRFDISDLGAASLIVLEVLKRLGAEKFEVSYDGGHDEGFAYPVRVYIGGQAREIEEIVASPAMKSSVDEMRRQLRGGKENWYYGQPDAVLAMSQLDELAMELSSKLLGRGFGTGEYALYGSFVADLKTGRILDNPHAKPRSGGLGA